jgi:hypothetical protein
MTPRHTPERLTLDAILPHLRTKRVSKRNGERHVLAHCPAHDDANPSLSLTEKADGTLLWKCFAGCSQDAVREALERLADTQPATARPIAPRRNRQQPATAQAQPLTLAALADAKRLDAEKLIAWHVRELPDGGIEILYLTREGELHAVRYRLALEGDNRFKWKWRKDDTTILYGLWRLCEWTGSDTLYLCEGESDTWSLWHAELPALGIPGARMWKPEWWREVEGFERIVLIADADDAGAGLAKTLAKTCPDSLRERVQVLQLPDGIKDANELWQREGANAERFREALAGCAVEPVYHYPTCHLVKSSRVCGYNPHTHGRGEPCKTKSSRPSASSMTYSRYSTIATTHKLKPPTVKSSPSPSLLAKSSQAICAKPSSGFKPSASFRSCPPRAVSTAGCIV